MAACTVCLLVLRAADCGDFFFILFAQYFHWKFFVRIYFTGAYAMSIVMLKVPKNAVVCSWLKTQDILACSCQLFIAGKVSLSQVSLFFLFFSARSPLSPIPPHATLVEQLYKFYKQGPHLFLLLFRNCLPLVFYLLFILFVGTSFHAIPVRVFIAFCCFTICNWNLS